MCIRAAQPRGGISRFRGWTVLRRLGGTVIARNQTNEVPSVRSVLKKIALLAGLFYLSLYVPFALAAYLPAWYRLNCHWHTRCEAIGYDRASSGIGDLTLFLRHQSDLAAFSTQKEKLHLAEVREIFDAMFLAAVVAGFLLVLVFDRRAMAWSALAGIGILVACSAVLPFFLSFWRDIFHPLLFDNDFWINTPSDLSYYLMPTRFFRYTYVLILASGLLINGLIWLGFRKTKVN